MEIQPPIPDADLLALLSKQFGTPVTVLDWANALYGDFLYDVAWLDMWSPELEINGRFQQYYQEQGREIPHYDERFRCHQCYIALDSFRFFAKIGN